MNAIHSHFFCSCLLYYNFLINNIRKYGQIKTTRPYYFDCFLNADW